VFYLLWGMTYTMNDISYWGMLPSLSSDPKVRDTLVTLMSVFICIGQFAVAGVVPMVVAGNAITAYRVVALIVALAFIAFQTITYLGVTENPRQDNKEAVTLKKMFQIFARNDQLIAAGVASLLFNMGSNLLILFGVSFFYFEFGYSEGGTLIFLFTVMYGLGTLFSQALYATIASKLSRRQILNICLVALTLILSGIYAISQNISGLENEVGKGTVTTEQALTQANAYIAEVQTSQTFMLRVGMVAVPLLVLIGAYLILKKKYYIDEAEYEEILEKLNKR